LKIKIYSCGETEFDLDAEYQEPAIREAIEDGCNDVPSSIIDYTDNERSNISHDEYAIVTEDDGRELWRGWLTGDPDAAPPAGAAPEVTLTDAIDVLFRHRHELTPDALRSLQDIWACGSAARYGQPYETWFTDDPEFYASHDTAACEAEDEAQAGGGDGYPDSELEMDLLAYQRNGDDERDDQ
jgi:hypothetical protein